jgi:hypothetical protein
MKVLHPNCANTGNELTLKGIIFKEDRISWGDTLEENWNSEPLQNTEKVLQEVKQAKGKIQTALNPEKHTMEGIKQLKEEISGKKSQQDIWSMCYTALCNMYYNNSPDNALPMSNTHILDKDDKLLLSRKDADYLTPYNKENISEYNE